MKKVQLPLMVLILVCTILSMICQTNTFTFNVSGTVPPGFVSSLNAAAFKWSQYLNIVVPIKVNVSVVNSNFFPFSGIAFANGRQNFTNAPYANYLYVTALANQLAGVETNTGEYDMDIYFNLATPFYFGTGKPSSTEIDFISTAMHEIGHGLGFYSIGYVNSSQMGSFGNIPPSAISPATTTFPWRGLDGVPAIYDKYLVKKSGNSLVTCAAPNSTALGDSIKNGPIYFSGLLFANPSNLNSPIEVASGNGVFSFGEDLLHLDDSYLSTIMAYSWGLGDTVRIPTPRELGILREIGWNPAPPVGLKNASSEQISIDIYPNPASENISVVGKGIQSIKIYNALGAIMKSESNGFRSDELSVSLTDMPPGLYFAEIKSYGQNSLVVRRFVKE